MDVSFDSERKRRTRFDAGWADQEQKTKAFRVTGALEDSDTFRENGFLERKVLAPSAYFQRCMIWRSTSGRHICTTSA